MYIIEIVDSTSTNSRLIEIVYRVTFEATPSLRSSYNHKSFCLYEMDSFI